MAPPRARALFACLVGAGCGLSEFPIAGYGGTDAAPATRRDAPARNDRTTPSGEDRVDAGVPGESDAAPAPTGDELVLGGVPVARENIIVFLHLGHSNMAGRTDTPPEMRPLNFETHPQLWAYAKGGAWRPAREPLSGDYLTGSRKAGPGMSILHTARALAPGRYMVSIGRGHDGSIGGHCRSFRKGALLYDFVMAPAMELKGKVTFGAIFTMLGVNEFRRDPGNLPRFHECLEGIARDMRTDLGDPDIPFVMGDWEAGATGAFSPTQPYVATTREQIKMALANIPRAVLIPTEMLPMSDDHHYDLVGYKQWAERGFALLAEAELLPWATR